MLAFVTSRWSISIMADDDKFLADDDFEIIEVAIPEDPDEDTDE